FCTSALARWTVQDTLNLLDSYKISYEERYHGRLFLIGPATQIVSMFEALLRQELIKICWKTQIRAAHFIDKMFHVEHFSGFSHAAALVVATGGVAWPQAGATGIGYRIAESFGIPVVPHRPGLVPLRFGPDDQAWLGDLAGVSLTVEIEHAGQRFRDQVLFTHRGLSGPAILQVSCTWREGEAVLINWLPGSDVLTMLWEQKQQGGGVTVGRRLAGLLPQRMLGKWVERYLGGAPPAQCSRGQLEAFAQAVHQWPFRPAGTEGLEKAEATLGGIDTRALSSKTMEAKGVPGLYFVGEVMDVAGRLGGYNIHWALASGCAAGGAV
ncbi:MAG: aminoacetone oxidase family FAD-binding enzyme, partial [Sedimentisphaerales bacterium]|nr:aminoacetone oxidase family FAD-binding enzyme [Sedimentisphaerales bacterium]